MSANPDQAASNKDGSWDQSLNLGPKETRRIHTLIRLAKLTLFWEHLWHVLWAPTLLIGIYLLGALTGLLGLLPILLHWALLIAALGLSTLLIYQQRTTLGWPSTHAASRRLEDNAGLSHRPLSELEDVDGLSGETALWLAQQNWRARQLVKLRLALPHPSKKANTDPYTLRSALLLALFAAAIFTGPTISLRLSEGLWPGFAWRGSQGELNAWLTPPSYTRQAPKYLASGHSRGSNQTPPEAGDQTLSVVQGTKLEVRISGGSTPSFSGSHNPVVDIREPAHATASQKIYEVSYPLTINQTIEVSQSGQTLGEWVFNVTPDTPPTLTLTTPISTTRRNTLRFEFAATDDYGLTSIEANFTLDPSVHLDESTLFQTQETDELVEKNTISPAPVIGAPHIEIPISSLPPLKLKKTSFQDLTSHPWAGLPVTIEMQAQDGAGQRTTTPPQTLLLPERTFTVPLARAFVEQRRRLALYPQARFSVAGFLESFSAFPDTREIDLGVYLGMRAVYWRILHANINSSNFQSELASAADLLWNMALYLEDGDLSLAEKELRDAREALMSALTEGASDEEISKLLQDLKQALSRYLDALAETTDDGSISDFANPNADSNTIDQNDLEDMLNTIEDLASTGARDQARDMLSQLDEMLENMQTQSPKAPTTPQQSALSDALDEMQSLMDQQKQIMEETFNLSHDMHENATGMPNQAPSQKDLDTLEDLKAAQQSLNEQLEETMKSLGESGAQIPSDLKKAGKSMERAGDRLDAGRTDKATRSQGQALEQMRSGSQAMVEQLMESLGDMAQGKSGQGKGKDKSNSDPLGRAQNQGGKGKEGSGEIPDEGERQQAREILEELRRRAAQLGRPQSELDYLDRLLQRF
ncbi:MAG: TIGR02302 family protein [Parvibaculaceae bacterium]|nr:TIGR02302 family protein [Parvibaculaceae bacterium]